MPRFITFLIPFLLLSGQLIAQAQGVFHHLGISDGLSQNFIRSIKQTRDGFVWVGSQVGLDRYDSHDFRHFRSDRKDSTTLAKPTVWCLAEHRGLWIGTEGGLCTYDPQLERFERFPLVLPSNYDPARAKNIRGIFAGRADHLWVATEVGVVEFDLEEKGFLVDTVLLQAQADQKTGVVFDGAMLTPDLLLLVAENGGYTYDRSLGKLSPLLEDQLLPSPWYCMQKIGPQKFLIGTDDGLLKISFSDEGTPTAELVRLEDEEGHKGNIVFDIRAVYAGDFFAATASGLYRFSWPDQGALKVTAHYQHDNELENSLAGDQVQCLELVDSSWLYVGTRHGISILDIRPSPLQLFSINRSGDPLCSDAVKGMAVSPSGRYIVAGGDEGLNIFDLLLGQVQCLQREQWPDLRNNYIINVDPGPEPDSYWLYFRRGGADLLRGVETGQLSIERVMFQEAGTRGVGVYDGAVSQDGRHWLATSKGLYVYDPTSGTGSMIVQDEQNPFSLPDPYIFNVLVDSKDQLWLGLTRGGLARLEDEAEGSFENWRADPDDSTALVNDMVLDFIEDRQGYLWIATPGGLSVYFGADKFRSFTTDHGIPNNLIFGLLEDASGHVWVSTPGGLAKTRLAADSSLQVLDVFHTRDGLPIARAQYGFNELTDGSFALAGGGLQIFHPDSLQHRESPAHIVLTGYEQFNEAVRPAAGFELEQSIGQVAELRLPPNRNFPSFSFADLNFHPESQVQYEYRLVGMQEEWLPIQDRRYLSFPNLSPGKYRLELRALHPARQEAGPVTQLSIHQYAPWYKRWWAVVLWCGLLFGAGLGILRYRRGQARKIEAAKLAERESFRRRSARDFHDEAGNYLTRVGLLTEVARRKVEDNPELLPVLGQINSNVQQLREGMRDFIWALDPGNDSLYELLVRLKRFGQEAFGYHPAQFHTIGLKKELELVELKADQRRHLVLIFKEAMHNTLKHAPAATEVTLSAALEHENELTLRWRDNGKGGATDQLHLGNGLKNMQARAAKIGASCAIDSDDSGTVITIITHLGESD